jgi:hypothetical protein
MILRTASKFRLWVQEIWNQNCEERLTFDETPATITQYWNNYKWWLKREYRHRERKH